MFSSRIDRPLLFALLLLGCGGLVLLFSASGGSWSLLLRQGIRLAIGLAVMFVLVVTPPRYIRLLSPPLYAVALILLLAVLAFGTRGKGAERWLSLGFFRFQPAEVMKLALPLTLAWYFHEQPDRPHWNHVALGLIIIALPAVFIMIEPDLGTAVLILGVGVAVLFLAGVKRRYLLLLAVAFAAVLPLAWHFLHAYQRERLLIFLDPQSDPLGAGYHIIQSKIAIGSGSIFGQGFLKGTQAQLNFLPERTTDFIFAVYAEQFGMLGALALIALYAFIIGRGFTLAMRAHTRYGRLAAAGIVTTFTFYVLVNIGMVIGVVPVVGVPLPLVSYGGTSIVTVLAGFGILMSIAAHRRLIDT